MSKKIYIANKQNESKMKIAEKFIPALEKLSPEKRERVLGYAMGLADADKPIAS